jgi:hypothetical protein
MLGGNVLSISRICAAEHEAAGQAKGPAVNCRALDGDLP